MTILAENKAQQTDCPRCHAPKAYGPRTVFGQFWMCRCLKCRYYKPEPLPTIQKKIVYLDQFALSHILSAKEVRWAEVHQRLKLLSSMQVLLCPFSSIHVEESLLASQSRDDLKALYRDLGGGDKFLLPYKVTQNQLLDALHCYLGPDKPPLCWMKPRTWQEFAEKNPHRWWDDLMVFAEFPINLEHIARIQQRKDALHADLQSVAENWKGETNHFNDDVKREARSFGDSLLIAYGELSGGRRFDPNTPPGFQPGVMLVHWLAAEVCKARPDEPDPIDIVTQFLQSPEVANAPFQYIASRLWATIAALVRSKMPRQSKPSDNYDVTVISTFAPYCDAMIVDNEFRGMASQKNIDIERRFGVRLFSARTLPAFIGYLDELLSSIPVDHRMAVKAIYPHLDSIAWLKTN